MHRLVQVVVRASLSSENQQQWVGAAARLIDAAFPRDSGQVATWPTCALLLPHALAVVNHSQIFNVETGETVLLRQKAGQYLFIRGQYRQTLTLQEHVLAVYQRVLGEHHGTLTAMNNVAETRRALDDLHGARDLHQQALAGCRRVLGDDHPYTLTSMNNAAEIRRVLGDLPGAQALHEQTLAARQQHFGNDHPDTLNSMNNLALTRHAVGDPEGARQLLEQTLGACGARIDKRLSM